MVEGQDIESSNSMFGDFLDSIDRFSKKIESSILTTGDSGGPSFAKINNEWLVIGLTSFGLGDTGDYGSVSFDTRVSVHSDWICSISDSAVVRIDGC